ncbi:MAG: Spy/CpxP family protein refolding chaperone [Spirochaetia bacterium]|nr:Spy/CpxP family protein refolding chaperone [Spirochaetia bacterium]
MSRKLLISMLAASVFLAAGAVQAQHGPGPGGDHEGCGPMGGPGMNNQKHIDMMAKELGLSAAQKESVKKIHEKYAGQAKAQCDKMRPLHEDLRKLLEADKADLSKIRSTLEVIGAAQLELRMIHIQQHMEVEGILTPDQRTKMRAMHKKRMDEMQKHHKDGKGPGHGGYGN